MSWFSNAIGMDKKKEQAKVAGKAADSAATDFYGAVAPAGANAEAANSSYLSQLLGYDPTADVNTYAKGAYEQGQAGLKRTLSGLAGKSVGAGRLNTGFYDTDQGDVVTDVANDYNSKVNMAAMQAANMKLGAINSLGQFGQNQQNLFLSALKGRQQETADTAAAKEKAQSGLGGLLGSVAGGLGGLALGGWAGAAQGWKYGGEIGGAF